MLTVAQIKSIPDMKKEGMTTGQVATKLGVCRETVLRWERRLRGAGYEVISRKGRPPIVL